MRNKAFSILLLTGLCVATKSVYTDSDLEIQSSVCGLDESMNGTWVVLSADLKLTNNQVVVYGDDISITMNGITRNFLCIDRGVYYGEYLWKSKDVEDGYVCVLKTDIGASIIQRKIATPSGNLDPVPLPDMTDMEYLILCADQVCEDVLNLRKQE
ncbi:uncharacterized protein LOC132558318 [Ylistrum balloti]|uniref:uncharacterized protein LOC132558318 n=1 Tax=Ylistrum balloti TaxID=509963 RepID=UPI0029059B54|nr:uncharacterized protein LOC132558318 [Ylistrum balloti]